jgi:hypothetical protein
MLLLMVAAVYASRPVTPLPVVFAYATALTILTIVFRSIAQRRWAHLDWMRCRADATVRAAA